MLVLARGLNQRIFITLPDGRRVVVQVAAINRDSARIAIDAPGDVPVHREEVQEALDREAGR